MTTLTPVADTSLNAAHPAGSSAAISLTDLALRIRTGCLYDLQPENTFGLLVTREVPRRLHHVRVAIQAHWHWFAPSFLLLTGHTGACSHRRCRYEDAPSAGHRCDVAVPRQQLGWEAFAAAYRAELDRWPHLAHVVVVQQISRWLQTFETVTILSFESSMPRGAALAAWTQRGAVRPYTQRQVFRDWLLTGSSMEM